ncbi:MAG TPA: tRNA 4-thiouridine(8) synthase ThiI [Clostridiales bacterium]|nr:tRNA 4-thiouridine(8) synthase ThiI [Clostridiales bacterium]
MKEVILIKYGEMALKGLNRSTFEALLIKNLKKALKPIGEIEITRSQSTIFIEPQSDEFDFNRALEKVKKVFGIAAFSRACVANKNIQDILKKAEAYLAERLKEIKTFKVEAKRSDKKFPLTSPQISAQLGGYLLKRFPHLKVDVHNPDEIVTVEVRDFGAYIRAGQLAGAGGMPVGSGGRAAVLISGGIDSPVAAWMMAKRGIELCAVHFASPPYTSERAEIKVRQLLEKVAEYSGEIKLAVVPFTEIQEEIGKKCPEEYFTLIMRRFMMMISERIAKDNGCLALITGESVGQVASQTIQALAVTDAATEMPVFRPLIGMDKEEIVEISRKIDTFEISIQPYDDCCTVFTPRHPKTKPQLEQIIKAEQALDIETLIDNAIKGTRYSIIE